MLTCTAPAFHIKSIFTIVNQVNSFRDLPRVSQLKVAYPNSESFTSQMNMKLTWSLDNNSGMARPRATVTQSVIWSDFLFHLYVAELSAVAGNAYN